jgi:hypothetical protein
MLMTFVESGVRRWQKTESSTARLMQAQSMALNPFTEAVLFPFLEMLTAFVENSVESWQATASSTARLMLQRLVASNLKAKRSYILSLDVFSEGSVPKLHLRDRVAKEGNDVRR